MSPYPIFIVIPKSKSSVSMVLVLQNEQFQSNFALNRPAITLMEVLKSLMQSMWWRTLDIPHLKKTLAQRLKYYYAIKRWRLRMLSIPDWTSVWVHTCWPFHLLRRSHSNKCWNESTVNHWTRLQRQNLRIPFIYLCVDNSINNKNMHAPSFMYTLQGRLYKTFNYILCS